MVVHESKIVLYHQDIDPITPLPHTPLLTHTHISQLLFSSRKWVSPPSGWSRADPPHSGFAKVSLGGCELSAQSPTEEADWRLTGSLEQSLEHWSVREAEVKPCGAGAETSPRTEAGSPEHRRQPFPWDVGCGWG